MSYVATIDLVVTIVRAKIQEGKKKKRKSVCKKLKQDLAPQPTKKLIEPLKELGIS